MSFNFGGAAKTGATATLPSFGGTAAAPSFGITGTAAAPSFGSTGTAAAPSFGSTGTAAAPSFGSTGTAAAPSFGSPATSTPSFGGTGAAAPTFGGTGTAAPTFGGTGTAAPTFGGTTPGFSASITPTTALPAVSGGLTSLSSGVQSSSSTAAGSINFHSLEELINKWRLDMEEQEKTLITQATQVNAWDKILTSNGCMISALSENVETVKTDQQKLDHELDFISSQQRELTDILTPLEAQLAQVVPSSEQHSSAHREHTYQLAENIDAQLQRMTEDLKEIISHMNSGSSTLQEEPLSAVCTILNAHMDSLQWIDHNIVLVQGKLDDVDKNTTLIMDNNKNKL